MSPEGADTGEQKAVQGRGQNQSPWRMPLLHKSKQLYHLVQDGAGEARKDARPRRACIIYINIYDQSLN